VPDDPPAPPSDDPPEATPPITIEEEMRRSFLDYSMSVIVARALPDVCDGLKPVHRRILFSMHENGYTHDKPHRKSARVVGDVIGKYHPHGESAIYDALVRMAQPFSMGSVLIDGQGNFGSLDADPPAAMRYTEARLSKLAAHLLGDIDQDTVDFNPNYDETEHEPAVLPAAFPNLLVNGAGGIAVGMATNIPTHNFTEVIDATLALLDDPEITLDGLMAIMPGPDFPTGGVILGRAGIRSAFATGRGSIVLRAQAAIEDWKNNRQAIVISEVPYQVNKARVLEKLAELVRGKEIEGISDIRDESDRSGVRMVIEVKRDANAEVVLNQLWRRTELQTTFAVNTLALVGGRPVQLALKQVLEEFVAFRDEVILRRSRFQLNKARDRAHALVGLAIASDNIDAVIALIRSSRDAGEARGKLMDRDWPAANVAPLLALIDAEGNRISDANTVRLTEAQARAILDLRLQRLTALERDAIEKELGELSARIRELLDLVGSQPRRLALMRAELVELRDKFPQPRRTAIEESDGEVEDESLIEQAEMVVTLTQGGLIKRVALAAFRAQRRGGRGRAGMATRDDDVVTRILVANTHQWVLFFSSRGMAYRMKVWRLPEAEPQAKGRSLKGFLPLSDDETITAVLALPLDETLWPSLHLLFATSEGNVRRNRLSDFGNVRQNGLIAMKLAGTDSLIAVVTCRDGDDILLATRRGRALRFQLAEQQLRVFSGRSSDGVRGIKLGTGDALIAATTLTHVDASAAERTAYLKAAPWKTGDEDEAPSDEATEAVTLSAERMAELAAAEEFILTVTETGMGKRSSAYDYRVTGRGGQGIENLGAGQVARVAAVFPVKPDDQVVLVTDGGQLIRCPVAGVRITGRRSRGVILFRAREDERVVSVFPVLGDDDDAGEVEADPAP
jgi:DNA gyrase subunit A